MAAIAYVTDEKMLEFHRYNGSHSIVFWRLSTKKFSDFRQGDLLFFLAKDANQRKKEKGLIGYGCFTDDNSLTLKSAWYKYDTALGYNSKREFEEAVEKSNKSEEMPKRIGCLILEKVVFFQSPIFLSQLGYKLSNKLESFTYLDKNGGAQTLKILQAAREIGLDSWSAMQNENINDELFEQQLIRYQIATVLEKAEVTGFVTERKAQQLKGTVRDDRSVWVNQQENILLSQEDGITITCLYDSQAKNNLDNYYRLLGMLISLENQLKEVLEVKPKLKVLSAYPLEDKQIELLRINGFEYQQAEI